jgi:hypothetical protein
VIDCVNYDFVVLDLVQNLKGKTANQSSSHLPMKNRIQARIPFQGTDGMVYTPQEIVTQLLIPFVVPPNRFDEIEFSLWR